MNTNPRVMQMIDSLSIGGAERVSVNYANAIAELGYKSYHCTTREEGMLKTFIHSDVEGFFMNKKSLLDKSAYIALIKFIRTNKITIIHAHSSSFFTAVIAKLFTGVKIVWHDHYGLSENLQERKSFMLQVCSVLFSYVISVNKNLEIWAKNKLYIKSEKIEYISNYADLIFSEEKIDLPGSSKRRIVCLANLRAQKDHFNLLNAFVPLMKDGFSDWHLLLVGRDFNDKYSDKIKKYIKENSLGDNVHVLGGRSDTAQILKQSTIGVLSSMSEGLPVALLEYGLAKLPVVATDVGECSAVLDGGHVGKLVEANNSEALRVALKPLMSSENEQEKYSQLYSDYIEKNYSKNSIINHVIEVYKTL